MHEKTSTEKWELVLAYHCEGQIKCLLHEDFKVDSEDTNFKLHLGSEVNREGFPKDQEISVSANAPFSTVDRDNDEVSRNCAQFWKGGWWHKGCYSGICPNCYSENDNELLFPIGTCSHTYMAMKPLKQAP